MHSLSLTPKEKQKEVTSTQPIARNNNFPQHLLHKLNRKIKKNQEQTKKETKTKLGQPSRIIVQN
jgi:hypothetical protein